MTLKRFGVAALVSVVALAAGCATKAEVNALVERLNTLDAKVGALENTQSTLAADVRAGEQKLTQQLAGADRRIGETADRVGRLETGMTKVSADLAAASGTLSAVDAGLKKLDARFAQVSASIENAQKMFIKNLENARDIYGAQYRALSEILETMQPARPEQPKEPPKGN